MLDDLAGEKAIDDRTALAADKEEADSLARRLQFERLVARGLDDVRVERAGQPAVAVWDEPPVGVALAGARQPLRRAGGGADRRGAAGDAAFEPPGIGGSGSG